MGRLEVLIETLLSFAELFVRAIGHLAWPLAILGIVLVLFRPLRSILTGLADRVVDLTDATGPGFSVKFAQRAEKIDPATSAFATSDADSHMVTVGPVTGDIELTAVQLIRESPRHAVIEAYIYLERVIRQVITSVGEQIDRTGPTETALRSKHLPPALKHGIRELRTLRNQAAHAEDFNLTPDGAAAYVEAVEVLVERLETYAHQLVWFSGGSHDGQILFLRGVPQEHVFEDGERYVRTGTGHSVGEQPTRWQYRYQPRESTNSHSPES